VKISCPACAAKYSIADEKVSDRLAKIRCRKCNATIVIDGKANPPSVYTAAGEATTEASDDGGDSQAAGLQFTVDFGEGDQRTMTVPEVVAAYNAGQITQDTYLWADGFADWKPLSEVDEVVSALNSGAAAPAPAAAPWASAAASPARTAARTAARAPAPDLFGGIDAAGSEDDVATSAPEHSSGAGRGGGGGLGLGSSGSSGASGGSGTGARNESSVLFSLSALTSAASRPSSRPVAPITAPTGAATREDSGLIDLKALTAAATKSDTSAAAPLAAAPLISPLAAPPLGIASPLGGGLGLGAPAADYGAYGAPQAKNKTGLYIGGGIAVAAIAAVAIVFMLRPPPPPPAPPPVAAAPALTPPPPAPAPTPDVTATPPSTGTGATEEAPKAGAKPAAGGVRRPGSTAVKKPGGAATPAAAPADAPAAPKPKRNPCGCAPGDLQCAMRCAAG
jgi:predicted Zn finger-like uncharacterized protein